MRCETFAWCALPCRQLALLAVYECFNECGDSPTAGVVEEFAGDKNLFVTE